MTACGEARGDAAALQLLERDERGIARSEWCGRARGRKRIARVRVRAYVNVCERHGEKGARWKSAADREGEIGDRVANAGRVAVPLGGANGTILSEGMRGGDEGGGEVENGETRVCIRTHRRSRGGGDWRDGE